MCNQNEISNMIGYHQPDLSTNMTVYASCLWLDSVIGQLKGQLTRYTGVSRPNLSVIMLVIDNSDSRVNHPCDYRSNLPPLGPITIIIFSTGRSHNKSVDIRSELPPKPW